MCPSPLLTIGLVDGREIKTGSTVLVSDCRDPLTRKITLVSHPMCVMCHPRVIHDKHTYLLVYLLDSKNWRYQPLDCTPWWRINRDIGFTDHITNMSHPQQFKKTFFSFFSVILPSFPLFSSPFLRHIRIDRQIQFFLWITKTGQGETGVNFGKVTSKTCSRQSFLRSLSLMERYTLLQKGSLSSLSLKIKVFKSSDED